MRMMVMGLGVMMMAVVGLGAELGVEGTRFTVDGKPVFLLGCSYYGALGAKEETIRGDLDRMQECGFNWIRVWATWAAFGEDVSAVDRGTGEPRKQYLEKLIWLIRECDRRGMVVDVTLSRGNGVTGPERLQPMAAHERAVETLVDAMKAERNWYIDLSNERNIRDERFTSIDELARLRRRIRQMDEKRLVTASHAGDLTKNELLDYVKTVEVDFVSWHRPRDAASPGQTQKRTVEALGWIRESGRVVPLHYDEPFRRGYGSWEPKAEDFLRDLEGAIAGGAAGWCFHNGDQRGSAEGRPRRSFGMKEQSLFEQLDDQERALMESLRRRRRP